jgi:PAS domain S-box-containing protein
MKPLRLNLQGLSAQMVASFIALVLLMAAAAGVPAVWLIRGQLDRQAWAQIEQGSLAAQALYASKQSELGALATLTAQRPTLLGLLAQGGGAALSAYIATLREASQLDLVLVCDSGHRAVAQAGWAGAAALCSPEVPAGFYVAPQAPTPAVWLVAAHPLAAEGGDALGTVIVGLALDDRFAAQMRSETGLEHTLLVNGQPAATSLADRRLWPAMALQHPLQDTVSLDGHRYFLTTFPLATSGLDVETALDVTEVALTQRRLLWTLGGSILGVALVACLLGIFLARRIGRPLSRLAEAASSMSAGDLDTPLEVEAHVREVTMVAQALETARVDLKHSLSEFRQEKAWTDHLLEAIVEGIVTLDYQGHITFFSHGAERITGLARDQVVGRTCDRVFNPVETDRPFSQLIPAPGRRHKISVELQDGRQAVLAVTGARLLPPEGRDARVALVFRDVSEEEAMHRLLAHFLANVAHEFRTPLSALAASVELLLDQAPDLTAAELAELLTSLHLGVLGLQTLIDNLLESASIEAGHFRVYPRPSSLGEIIAAAVGTMQPLLEKHDQRLVVELPASIPVVQADPRRTAQVLINLLSNAVKYGPDDAEIEVVATVQDGWVRVAVADSGSGVPPESRGDLFRRFTRRSAGNEKAEVGAGLGLSVVKAVVEAHGGEVGIEDRPQGGSVFWFTLPVVHGS